jgi:hypothetical protein
MATQVTLSKLRIYTAIIITVVWIVNVAVSLVYPDRTINPYPQAIMVIAAGWLFGGQYIKARDRDDEDREKV